jgi:hypothetical protein
MTCPANIFFIYLALVPKRLHITVVNNTHSKRDTVQQALEDIRKKTGYMLSRCVITMQDMKSWQWCWWRHSTDVSKQRSASIFKVIKSIRRNIPKHLKLDKHHCENLKSLTVKCYLRYGGGTDSHVQTCSQNRLVIFENTGSLLLRRR